MREIQVELECHCPRCGDAEAVLLVVTEAYEPAPRGWPTDLGIPFFGRGVVDMKAKCSACDTERTLKAPVISNGKVLA